MEGHSQGQSLGRSQGQSGRSYGDTRDYDMRHGDMGRDDWGQRNMGRDQDELDWRPSGRFGGMGEGGFNEGRPRGYGGPDRDERGSQYMGRDFGRNPSQNYRDEGYGARHQGERGQSGWNRGYGQGEDIRGRGDTQWHAGDSQFGMDRDNRQGDWFRDNSFRGGMGGGMGGMSGGMGGGMGQDRGYSMQQGGQQQGGQQWQQQQRRYPKGPKGYKRSDERIKEDVCDCLSRMEEIDSSEIEVTVSNGEVTLTGTVPERRMKFMAEQMCEGISAVTDVNNNIRVKRDESQQSGQGMGRSQQSTQQIGSTQSGQTGQAGQTGQQNENGRRATSSRF